MKMAIIGFGPVGMAIAASALDFHPNVTVDVIDKDPMKHAWLREIAMSLMTHELKEHPDKKEILLLFDAHVSGKLSFRLDYKFLKMEEIDCFFVCVPADAVQSVVAELSECLKDRDFVSIESTILLDDIQHIRRIIKHTGKNVFLVFSPERIMEGELIKKFRGERKLIGGDRSEDIMTAHNIFSTIGVCAVESCTPEYAVLAKLVENSWRYWKIAFSHMIADLCHRKGIEFDRIRDLVSTCSSVDSIPYSSIGIGGHCLESSLSMLAKEGIMEFRVIERYEKERIKEVISWIQSCMIGLTRRSLGDIRVLFVGATYRPDGSSMKNSKPAEVINYLAGQLEECYVYDPLMQEPIEGVSIVTCEDMHNLDVDVVVLLQSHSALYMSVEEILENKPNAIFINLTSDVPEMPYESIRVARRAW